MNKRMEAIAKWMESYSFDDWLNERFSASEIYHMDKEEWDLLEATYMQEVEADVDHELEMEDEDAEI